MAALAICISAHVNILYATQIAGVAEKMILREKSPVSLSILTRTFTERSKKGSFPLFNAYNVCQRTTNKNNAKGQSEKQLI